MAVAAMTSEKKIYRLFVILILLTIISLVIPRFIANPNGGFAAATTAALSFLLALAVSLLFSVYMLVFTLKNSANISKTAKLLGIIPSIILAIIFLGLIIFVSIG